MIIEFFILFADAIQFVLFFNLVCMGLYTALYFLGCDNVKMAGATQPYFNRQEHQFSSFLRRIDPTAFKTVKIVI